jgi:hypothetical protein
VDCKRAGKRLKELALSGATAVDSPELAAHVNACSVCCEMFARERAFVAAMNLGVAATVAGQPSPALQARVREQLAAPVRRWELRWAVVAAAALLALVFSLRALLSHRTQPEPNDSSVGGASAAAAPVAPPASFGPVTATRRANLFTHARVVSERDVLTDFPLVLTEKGEREATLRFVAEVRDGRVDPVPILTQQETREVARLEIVPLDLPLLAEADSSPSKSDAP